MVSTVAKEYTHTPWWCVCVQWFSAGNKFWFLRLKSQVCTQAGGQHPDKQENLHEYQPHPRRSPVGLFTASAAHWMLHAFIGPNSGTGELKCFLWFLKLSLPPPSRTHRAVSPLPASPDTHRHWVAAGVTAGADVPRNLRRGGSQDRACQRHLHPLPDSVDSERDPEHRCSPRAQLNVFLLHTSLFYSLWQGNSDTDSFTNKGNNDRVSYKRDMCDSASVQECQALSLLLMVLRLSQHLIRFRILSRILLCLGISARMEMTDLTFLRRAFRSALTRSSLQFQITSFSSFSMSFPNRILFCPLCSSSRMSASLLIL